jgi:hypothetical protein
MAAQSKVWAWDWALAGIVGSNPTGGHGCLSLVSVVCCQVEVCASGWSHVQRSPTDCGVSECDREASIMRGPWSARGCCACGRRIRIVALATVEPIWLSRSYNGHVECDKWKYTFRRNIFVTRLASIHSNTVENHGSSTRSKTTCSLSSMFYCLSRIRKRFEAATYTHKK